MFTIDISDIDRDAAATLLLLDAIRRRDVARKMMLGLWPKISALREALAPLEAEYSKWATQHYSFEYRIAEIKKVILSPRKVREESAPSNLPHEMTEKQADKYFHSLNATEQAKLIVQLEALRKET